MITKEILYIRRILTFPWETLRHW